MKELLQSGHSFEFARKPRRTGLELITFKTDVAEPNSKPKPQQEKGKEKPTTAKTVKTS